MSDSDPWHIRLLERLGFNVTRLRWKWMKSQERARQVAHPGGRPGAFHWLKYPHKNCVRCGALNDRAEKRCTSCGVRLPGMFMQRVSRLMGSVGAGSEGLKISRIAMTLVFVVYAMQVAFGGFSIQSLLSPHPVGFLILGSLDYTYGVTLGQYWRFLAFGLVHGNALHIGMNCWVLLQLMPLVESHVERGRLLVMLTIWQLTAGIVTVFWYHFVTQSPSMVVGASGWLFGAMGYGILWSHRNGYLDIRNSLMRWTGIILLLGFGLNAASQGGGIIGNAAHVGGLLAGLATAAIPQPSRRNPGVQTVWNVAFLLCLALWIVTLGFMALSVYHNWPEASRYIRG